MLVGWQNCSTHVFGWGKLRKFLLDINALKMFRLENWRIDGQSPNSLMFPPTHFALYGE